MQGATPEVSTNEHLIRTNTDQKTPVNYNYLKKLEKLVRIIYTIMSI